MTDFLKKAPQKKQNNKHDVPKDKRAAFWGGGLIAAKLGLGVSQLRRPYWVRPKAERETVVVERVEKREQPQ